MALANADASGQSTAAAIASLQSTLATQSASISSLQSGLTAAQKVKDCADFLVYADRLGATANHQITADLRWSNFNAGQQYAGGLNSGWYYNIQFPFNGTYQIELASWKCGVSGSNVKYILSRNGVIYYLKWLYGSEADCNISWTRVVVNVQAGDLFTMKGFINPTGNYSPDLNPTVVDGTGKLLITCRQKF
jgi:hypothetical protein